MVLRKVCIYFSAQYLALDKQWLPWRRAVLAAAGVTVAKMGLPVGVKEVFIQVSQPLITLHTALPAHTTFGAFTWRGYTFFNFIEV